MKQEIIKYARGLEATEDIIAWIEKRLPEENINISEAEHIIDYLIAVNPKLRSMTYAEAKNNSGKWTKTQQKKGNNIGETLEDVQTVLDFKDGFKVVKLIGENAYKREGYLMGHCVASYFGKNDEIYSLRDKNNIPHCTMSKSSQQVKGKGNGDIHPKYINYVVKFLEWSGIPVRDSEMAHLGYIVPEFVDYVSNDLYKKRYLRKTETVIYKKNVNIITDISQCKPGKINLLRGDLGIPEKTKIENRFLFGISSSVYVREGAKFNAPLLKNSGYVDVEKRAKFNAPLLKNVSGSVYVREGAKFNAPLLKNVSGSVDVRKGAKFNAPLLKNVSGYVDVYKDAKFNAPLLKNVSGSMDVYKDAKFNAPLLGHTYTFKKGDL